MAIDFIITELNKIILEHKDVLAREAIVTDKFHVIPLEKNHYVVMQKDPISDDNKAIFNAIELTLDEKKQELSLVKNSLYGIAKKLRPDDSKEQKQQTVDIHRRAGLSACTKPIDLDGADYLFMQNIDKGVALKSILEKKNGPISLKEICACLRHAMQDALTLRDAGIVHLDLQISNITFPSGRCIDLEYHATTDSPADSHAKFSLPVTTDLLGSLSEELNIPETMMQFDEKSSQLSIDKHVIDYEFNKVIRETVEHLTERHSMKDNDAFIIALRTMENDLSTEKMKLPEAIKKLDALLLSLQENKSHTQTLHNFFSALPRPASPLKGIENTLPNSKRNEMK